MITGGGCETAMPRHAALFSFTGTDPASLGSVWRCAS
jgi:hypothetical protein